MKQLFLLQCLAPGSEAPAIRNADMVGGASSSSNAYLLTPNVSRNGYQAYSNSAGHFHVVEVRWQTSLQIIQVLLEPVFIFCFVYEGQLDIQIDDQCVTTCCPEAYGAVINPGQPWSGLARGKGHAILIGVPYNLVEESLKTVLRNIPLQSIKFESSIDISQEPSHSLWKLVQLLWQADGLLHKDLSDLILTELEQGFIQCICKGLVHNYSERMIYKCTVTLSSYVQKAQAYIEANLQSSLRVGEIAAVVGISPRMLERAFACHCGCSPMQFLKRTRLQRVREELCHPTPETKVTDVMTCYGFEEGGKFASAYREMFGELPSETLKQHRKALGLNIQKNVSQ